MTIHGIRCAVLSCLGGVLLGAAHAQDLPPRCAAMLPDAPALVPRTGPIFKYPEAAFAAGREGNVGYQYRLADASGKAVVDCLYKSSGDKDIDAAVVERLNSTFYNLPKGFDWERDKARIYQNSWTLSWNAENLARIKPVAASIAEGRVVYAPKPGTPQLPYPFEGITQLRSRVTGSGEVDMVSMLKASGDAKLDATAMATMLAYKFKPGDPFWFDQGFSFKIN